MDTDESGLVHTCVDEANLIHRSRSGSDRIRVHLWSSVIICGSYLAMSPLRIGILGAARIAPMALIRPARQVPEATIAAVAARDPARARAFATKHGIARTLDSYDALIADPEIDAIYNPLPNGLHALWSIRAME